LIVLRHPHPWTRKGPFPKRLLSLLMLLATLLGQAGCSVIPSPLIVGKTYTNFEYEFSADLPDGWVPAEDPEDVLERKAGWVDADMASLVLTRPDSQALIAVMNEKLRLALPRYINLDPPYWQERIEEMRDELDAEVEVKRFDYHVYKDNLVTTQQNYFLSQRAFKPEMVFGVDALIVENKVPQRLIFEWFLVPCQKEHACQTIVMMVCHEDHFEENKGAFDEVVGTLRAHDYYD
jgi:hypothetical protein